MLKFKMSSKCPGKDKFNNPCNVYLRPNEKYCWKHVLTTTNANEEETPSANIEAKSTSTVNFKYDEKRLQKLANDEQNIHTPEIQIPLMNAIKKIQAWGQGMKINTSIDLPNLILSMLDDNEFNFKTELALEHLRNIFESNDNTEMFDITYMQLSVLVWARIHYCFSGDEEKFKLLKTRFFEEITESIGQCFNGNIARLINVFSGIDSEMSIQLASITREQFVELLLDKIDLLTPEMALQRTYQLFLKAQIPDEEQGPWIQAVRDRKGVPLIPYKEIDTEKNADDDINVEHN